MGLTVYARHLHTVAGSRQDAIRHFKAHGVALWFRACGKKAVLFYQHTNGCSRVKTFKVDRVLQADSAQGLLGALADASSS